jgi:hypothetical protein
MMGVITIGKALIVISLIALITIVDSQFISLFYGTELGIPTNFHLIVFTSSAVVISFVSVALLKLSRRTTIHIGNERPLVKTMYICTSIVQYSVLLILLVMILEMFIYQEYDKRLSLIAIYSSHFFAAILLSFLTFTFLRWFRYVRSFSFLIYGVVFSVIVILILLTIPLLTEQFLSPPQTVYPRDYTTLILNLITPSRDIAFIYSLGNYVLPVMIISSWVLTVSLLRTYADRLGKNIFWLIVSIPLIYQIFTFLVRDANFSLDPALIQIVYSRQIQFLFGISYQVSGLFFSIAFLGIARKMKRASMKNYLVISSIGVMSLFSAMEPGIPFYAAYPPFGLITITLLGLSSYMLLVGMLGMAAYVSRDGKLRREIQGLHSELLKNVGMAEMQREVENRVLPLVDKITLSEDMRARMDPSEEDVKAMIKEVLEEIHYSGIRDKQKDPDLSS